MEVIISLNLPLFNIGQDLVNGEIHKNQKKFWRTSAKDATWLVLPSQVEILSK